MLSSSEYPSVLIRVEGRDPRGEKAKGQVFSIPRNGMTCLSASGTVISHDTILATYSVVEPFVENKNSSDNKLLAGTSIHAMYPGSDPMSARCWRPATLIATVDLPAVDENINALVGAQQRGWTAGWKVAGTRGESFRIGRLIVLHIDDELPLPAVPCSTRPNQGAHVLLVGSPYGLMSPAVFSNAVTSGIISTVVSSRGEEATVCFTDAHCMPGMEGGPVLCPVTRQLQGILLPPLRRVDGLPVDLHPFAPTHTLLQHVSMLGNQASPLQNQWKVGQPPSSSLHPWNECVAKTSSSIVALRVGPYWGSGIVLADQHILTNAHVVVPNSRSARTVSVRLPHGPSYMWKSARVVFVPSDPLLDVALLKLLPDLDIPRLQAISLSPVAYRTGDPVVALGYAVFEPIKRLGPTATAGVIASVTLSDGHPIMLQTSASIHRGNSGGALLNTDGELLGIVTSNAKSATTGTEPKLNFSVPVDLLSPIEDYLACGDIQVLSSLNAITSSPSFQSAWTLQSTPPPSNDEQRDEANAKRGSMFEAFTSTFSGLKETHIPSKL